MSGHWYASMDIAVLLPKLLRVLAPLPVQHRRGVRLPLEPALAKGVVVPAVERPALWLVAKDPRVAWFVSVGVGVGRTAIAALRCRLGPVRDTPRDRHAARVGVRLLAAFWRRRDTGTVSVARRARFGGRAHMIATDHGFQWRRRDRFGWRSGCLRRWQRSCC